MPFQAARKTKEGRAFFSEAVEDLLAYTSAVAVQPLLAVSSAKQRLVFALCNRLTANAALLLGRGGLGFLLRRYLLAFLVVQVVLQGSAWELLGVRARGSALQLQYQYNSYKKESVCGILGYSGGLNQNVSGCIKKYLQTPI